MVYKILVVDDEAPAREKIIRFLKQMNCSWDISAASNAENAITLLESQPFDLMLLDIQMPQMDAFEMLHKLNLETLPTLIFSTAYDQYALQAFEIHAVDYLLKPFHFERFESALLRALQLQIAEKDKGLRMNNMIRQWESPKEEIKIIWVNKAGKIIPVPIDSIVYLEADGNYILIHSDGQSYMLRQSLKEIHKCLDTKRFVQVHKSYILNKLMIKELIPKSHGDLYAIMKSGQKVPVSRNYRNLLMK